VVRIGGAPSRVIRVDAAHVAEGLESLQAPDRVCDHLVQQYEFGIVYAVMFEESDVPNLEDTGGSGILHRGVLGPDRIVGKARLYLFDQSAPPVYDHEASFSWTESPLA
jgi:hypothetical protein